MHVLVRDGKILNGEGRWPLEVGMYFEDNRRIAQIGLSSIIDEQGILYIFSEIKIKIFYFYNSEGIIKKQGPGTPIFDPTRVVFISTSNQRVVNIDAMDGGYLYEGSAIWHPDNLLVSIKLDCPECKGSGWYIGLLTREPCKLCTS